MFTIQKILKWNRSTLVAFTLIVLAFAFRVILIANSWPATSSEEGTFGLEAMHIAYRGAWPIFMYGQNYMGTLEAYVGALYFHLFGISVFSLRLGMLTLFALFLISLYFLTKLLYSPQMGLITLVVLSVGSTWVLIPEMMVLGGTTETLLFGTLLLLLATHLALSSGQEAATRHKWQRLAGFAAWGCCAGLGLWSHLLVAPFLLVSGLLLGLFCRREIRTWAPFALFGGLIVGMIPLIMYNATAPLGQNSIATFLSIYNIGSPAAPGTNFFLKQLSGTFLFTLPSATGVNTPCDVRSMPFFGAPPFPIGCVLVQGGWSLGYLALLLISLGMAGWGLYTLKKLYPGSMLDWPVDKRREAVVYTAQGMLALAATITLALFAHSANAASRPWSTRYLVGLLIATPALLWPLWNGVNTRLAPTFAKMEHIRPLTIVRWAMLVLLVGLFASEIFHTATDMPAINADNAQVNALTHDLIQMDITHIYSGYWQCDRFIFQTQENIICAVVNEDLSRGLTRYAPYYTIVHADTRAAYVFPQASPYEINFEQKTAQWQQHFQKIVMDGYVVYRPL